MARKVYHVTPQLDMWIVQMGGTVVSSHYTKQAAIDAARNVAQANQPSQVVVHKQDGTIETEGTYGHDPFPPKGKEAWKSRKTTTRLPTTPSRRSANSDTGAVGTGV